MKRVERASSPAARAPARPAVMGLGRSPGGLRESGRRTGQVPGDGHGREVAAAIARAAAAAGWACDEVPMADGGEGTLDVLGGPNRTTVVTDPLGDPVEAEWRHDAAGRSIEMATASGLAAGRGRRGQRSDGGVDLRHRRAHRGRARRRRPPHRGRCRRIGDDRRRPRRAAGAVPRPPAEGRRAARRVRRRDPLRRRRGHVRPAEGRHPGAGRAAAPAARAPGPGVPGGLRRRRPRAGRRRGRRRARRRTGGGRRPPGPRLRPRRRRARPAVADRGRRPRDHRRGVPRRPVLRRQGRRRRGRAGRDRSMFPSWRSSARSSTTMPTGAGCPSSPSSTGSARTGLSHDTVACIEEAAAGVLADRG